MRTTIGILLALGAMALPSEAVAQGQQLVEDLRQENARRGTRGANFLQIGLGARAAALAGAVAADVEGISALYWNTAGIARAEGLTVGFSGAELYEDFDISIGHVGVLMPLMGGVAGLSVSYLSSGDIERTTVDFPQGNDPIEGSAFTYTGTAASFHYGRLITDRLAMGAAARYAQEGIEGATASYVGIDIGTQFHTGIYGTTIGASINNIGTEGRFQGDALRNRLTTGIPTGANVVDVERRTTRFAMPTIFRFSVLADLWGGAEAIVGPSADHRVRLMGDVSDGISTAIQTGLAVEYGFRERLFLRGGKKFVNEDRAPWEGSHGLGLGGGVLLPMGDSRLRLDYGYQPWGDLNSVQQISVELAF